MSKIDAVLAFKGAIPLSHLFKRKNLQILEKAESSRSHVIQHDRNDNFNSNHISDDNFSYDGYDNPSNGSDKGNEIKHKTYI